MNFIAKRLNAIGVLLLTAFVATAAGMYFKVPTRLPGSKTTATTANYSCPTHPEVVSNQSGDCPKYSRVLTSTANKLEGKAVGCLHAGVTRESAGAGNGSGHAGCSYAENREGGCCSKTSESASDVSPSGCTRNLHQQTVRSSE